MKRRSLVAVLALLVLGLAACGGSTPADDGGEAVAEEMVWAVGGADAAPGGTHRQVVDLWNEENPDRPVRIEQLSDSADEQRQAQALELQGQTDNFDILATDVIWTGEYAVNGWLESLEDVRDQIEPVVLEAPMESATWEGTLWAAPYNSNAGFLYYRTDLVDTVPETWQELSEVGRRIAEEQGISAFVGQGALYEGMVVNYLEYLWGAGGGLLGEEGEEVVYGDTGAAVEALEFMRTSQGNGFYAPGFNTMKEEEARAVFQAGDAVFMRNWPYAYTLMGGDGEAEGDSAVAGRFGIAPLPTFDGEGTTSALGGFNNGVSAFSDRKEDAKDFVVWAATDPEVQTLLGQRSLPPVRADVYEQLQDDPVMALLGRVLPEARPRPPAPSWPRISETMQQQVYPAYTGQSEIQPAVDAIREVLEEEIE
jgi:multiple sugar transport system substrate-binding protein